MQVTSRSGWRSRCPSSRHISTRSERFSSHPVRKGGGQGWAPPDPTNGECPTQAKDAWVGHPVLDRSSGRDPFLFSLPIRETEFPPNHISENRENVVVLCAESHDLGDGVVFPDVPVGAHVDSRQVIAQPYKAVPFYVLFC